MTFTISELNIYPIKSCQGTALNEAHAAASGFAYDRQWLVVNEEGEFLTQRQLPAMSQILPQIVPQIQANAHDNSEPVEMKLSAPGITPFTLQSRGQGETRKVVVWRDTVEAVDEGAEVAGWFSEYLKTRCRLVRFSKTFVRAVDRSFARTEKDQVGFADGFPFLLISEASLLDLNEKLSEPLRMNRFRPNIVVSGCPPFAEDGWKTVKAGNLKLHIVKPCARCVITCTDQKTSKVAAEPLKTLATYRNQMNKILFGQNLVPEGTGIVKVGDELEVLA